MENYIYEGINQCIPKFARGLNILLVDHDKSSLRDMKIMLQQFTYKVTTAELASAALSKIEEDNSGFRIVIASLLMPDMDTSKFMHLLLQKAIPIVVLLPERNLSKTRKMIKEGACFCLTKPVTFNEVKHIWQHAYRRKTFPTKAEANIIATQLLAAGGSAAAAATNSTNPQQAVTNAVQNTKRSADSREIAGPSSAALPPLSSSPLAQEHGKRVENERKDDDNNNNDNNIGSTSPQHKKKPPRAKWTYDLHSKFTDAVSKLGLKNARPASILKLMNVPDLTLNQVSSHLQRYKLEAGIEENTVYPLLDTSASALGIGAGGDQSFIHKHTYVPWKMGSAAAAAPHVAPMNSDSIRAGVVTPYNLQPIKGIVLTASGDGRLGITNPATVYSNHQQHGQSWQNGNVATADNIGAAKMLPNSNTAEPTQVIDTMEFPNVGIQTGIQTALDDVVPSAPSFTQPGSGGGDSRLHSQYYNEMVSLLEGEELTACEPNPADVDRYSAWLADALHGGSSSMDFNS